MRRGLLSIARPLAAGVASAAIVRSALEVHKPPADNYAAPYAPASVLPSASSLDELKFKGTFRGQLSPPLPEAGQPRTSTGPVVSDAAGISWQRGAYNAWWLRLGKGAPLPSAAQLSAALDLMLARATTDKSAAYVGVQELEADPETTALLRARGFKYHHFSPNTERARSTAGGSGLEPGEHVYYRWMGDPSHDMVPTYATSIEGVGALVLSPDETKVLLIWEYGAWKFVSGAVDSGEGVLTTLARECGEEVGVKIDQSYAPLAVGGWQISRARDDSVNDNFRAFVVRAASEDVAVDENEVSEAKWFAKTDLVKAYRDAGSPDPLSSKVVLAAPEHAKRLGLPENRRKLNATALDWFMCYASGGGQKCTMEARKSGEMVFVGSQR